MWNSLSEFYNSNEWKKLRLAVIAERLNNYGETICEECGKPIIKNYDCVAHHVQPLTINKVNDFSVSLNPKNIKLLHMKCHNFVHSRFGHCTERKVYYVYGAPCSGKTTFVNSIKGNSDIVCDVDNIWQCITGGARYEKPNALKYNMFEIRNCIFEMIKNRYPRSGGWERAFVIDGGAARTPRNNRINELGAEPIYIDTDKATCLQRLANDTTRTAAQKNEWRGYIDKWFNEYQE